MTVKYILDNREGKLQALFTTNSVAFESKQLDLGDILILYSKGEISTEKPLSESAQKLLRIDPTTETKNELFTFVIERKSYTDLKSSMSDGRYHEQKSRYLQLPKGTMFYILENNDSAFKQLDKKQYMGMYVHTMIRDNIQVFNTTSLEDTFQMILKIGETLEKFGFSCNDLSPSSSIEPTQIKKKKNKGKEVYRQQLCCFPGISLSKADSIVEVYPNLSSLMEAVKTEKFKVKGIGKVLYQTIKDGLFI